jgi:hypothetical protein
MTGEPERVEETRAGDAPAVIHLPDLRQPAKKVTSGSSNRRRRHVEKFRTDDEEHATLHDTARACGLTFGAYMRASKIGDAGPRAKRRAPVDATALTAALVAFNRAGNNQNQTTRALNELLLIASEQSNARLESLVLELADAIRGLPGIFAEPVAAILAALGHDREG